MPLKLGDRAPDFTLRDTEGREHSPVSAGGYSLLVFYKTSCPTCQLTLPFVEKMYEFYGERVSFFGIAQDPAHEVEKFARDYGLTFPQLIDHPSYEVSIDYDVQVVPTLYLIGPSGLLEFVEESFVKSSLEKLNSTLAGVSGREVNPLFEDVSVPPFKAG